MANLKLGLLGPLQVTVGQPPVAASFESDKARALLAYLAVESAQAHRREALVGLLWPDCPEEVARRNLRQSLYNIRRAVGDHTAQPPYFLITRDEIQFNLESDCSLDVSEFVTLLETCDQHLPRCVEACSIHAAHLEEAVALYRGPFLAEFFLPDSADFEEWAVQQREGLQRRVLEALTYLANYAELTGEFGAAERWARRQLEIDPWREEAHRQVMRALAAAGRRSEALAQYETCRRVLAKELGVEPSDETRRLYDDLKRTDAPAGAARIQGLPGWVAPSLPVQATPFIGRDRELAELGQLLADPECRLLTLVGPGGIGKTRLALQAASNLRGALAQGAVFIPLASLDSAPFLASVTAEALGLRPFGAGDPADQVRDWVADKQILLIFDNVEQLLSAGPSGESGLEFLLEILACAPRVKFLITSREPLNLQVEWVFPVGGLEVPASDEREAFEHSSAVALFLQRAQRVRLNFRLSDRDRRAVVRVCRLVGGVPLGIELAATWVGALSPDEIADEIERGLDFPAAAWRDLPERHRSMRAVFDHSWQLLSGEERRILSELSVFCCLFSREAAQAITRATLPHLSALMGKSLIRRTEDNRYTLHELVRQYAAERLAAEGDSQALHRKYFYYFLELAQEAESRLTGPEQIHWLDRLEKEHDNLRAALEWALSPEAAAAEAPAEERARRGQELLALVGALFLFWKRRDHWSEGRDWIGRALRHTADLADTPARAKALNGAVLLAVEQADVATAQRLLDENLALCRKLRDPHALAAALNAQGYLLWKRKLFGEARACCEEALTLFRARGSKFECAEALHFLGHIATNQGDYPNARKYLDESITLYEEIGDKLGLNFSIGDIGLVAYLQEDSATARSYFQRSLLGSRQIGSIAGVVSQLNGLGDLARYRGEFEQAGAFYSESLELYQAMGDKDEIPSILHNLGYVEHHRGDEGKALSLFKQALTMHIEMSNQGGIAECLAGIATVLAAHRPQQAARLFGASAALRGGADAVQWPANRIEYNHTLELLAQSLGTATFSAAFEEGQRMDLGDASVSGLEAEIS